jgi:hypothetical protein
MLRKKRKADLAEDGLSSGSENDPGAFLPVSATLVLAPLPIVSDVHAVFRLFAIRTYRTV